MIGALRCVRGVAGDVEDGAHDGHIDWIGWTVACSGHVLSASSSSYAGTVGTAYRRISPDE